MPVPGAKLKITASKLPLIFMAIWQFMYLEFFLVSAQAQFQFFYPNFEPLFHQSYMKLHIKAFPLVVEM